MSDWYLRRQLEHFQVGARGAHAEDAEGLRMRAMVRTLRTEADLEEIVAYVSSLTPVDPASSLEGGDASHGEELFTATCTECHGEGAQGNEERNAPPLNRASDWYLERQIMKFRAGVRGADPRDETGAQMRPMATSLPDDQAVRDVVAYISSLD
jgi:cytochrome c553